MVIAVNLQYMPFTAQCCAVIFDRRYVSFGIIGILTQVRSASCCHRLDLHQTAVVTIIILQSANIAVKAGWISCGDQFTIIIVGIGNPHCRKLRLRRFISITVHLSLACHASKSIIPSFSEPVKSLYPVFITVIPHFCHVT